MHLPGAKSAPSTWTSMSMPPASSPEPAKPAATRSFLGLRKLPARRAALVMPLLLSVFMTFVVSLVSTLRGIGLAADFLPIWLSAWGISWVIAFPTLLVVLPLVRRLTALLVDMPPGPHG